MITKEQIVDVLSQYGLQIEADKVSTTDSLKSLGIDSLDFFNALIEFEQITGKAVPDEDIDKIDSIDDILNYYS